MSSIPVPLAALGSLVIAAILVSLLVQRCALFEVLHVCVFH